MYRSLFFNDFKGKPNNESHLFTCNSTVSGSTLNGFIHSPDYPIYAPVNNCEISIQSQNGHQVIIYMLDLAIADYEKSTYEKQPMTILK